MICLETNIRHFVFFLNSVIVLIFNIIWRKITNINIIHFVFFLLKFYLSNIIHLKALLRRFGVPLSNLRAGLITILLDKKRKNLKIKTLKPLRNIKNIFKKKTPFIMVFSFCALKMDALRPLIKYTKLKITRILVTIPLSYYFSSSYYCYS